jgi:C1A family cysteine protease
MMAAVNLGVVSITVDCSGPKWQFYKEGVVVDCGENPNHAVAVVGYGYDSVAKLDYYLIKNSWGDKWG